MVLKVFRVSEFPSQLRESIRDQIFERLMVHRFQPELMKNEKIPQQRDPRQSLQTHIDIVRITNIIEPHQARDITLSVQSPRIIQLVQSLELLLRVIGIQIVLDVIQRFVGDLIVIRQTVDFGVVKVDEKVMALLQRVEIGLRVLATALVVFSAYEAGIDVDIG